MANLYDALYDGLINAATAASKPSPKELETLLHRTNELFSPMYPGQKVDEEALLRRVLQEVNTFVEEAPTVLKDNHDHEEWLSGERADISWNYWQRYKKYLRTEEKFPPKVIDSLDEATDDILRLLESPRRKGNWDRRGMVVGNIQSGKTSNYVGLICKAVDAGYKLIIVLAGTNNDLRSQTQKRIDKGFYGYDTSKRTKANQKSTKIGAGLIPGFRCPPVNAVTSSNANGDYRKVVHSSVTVTLGGDPVFAVVKKNVTPLRNLLNWFTRVNESGKIDNVPLLLIDDEADNASIDTKASKKIGVDESDWKENDPTKINGYIRQILKCFSQSAYVGYTATPFANIFIYPDADAENNDQSVYGEDLYPRSFIINLHAPSNYLGPEKVFGIEKDDVAGIEEKKPLNLIRVIDDYKDDFPEKHKSTLKVYHIPESLIRAIDSFILSCAARDARGQVHKHKSMLVHVTLFTDVQMQIVELLKARMKDIVNALEFKTGPQYDKLIKVLRNLWENDFEPTTKEVQQRITNDTELTTLSWKDVEPLIYKAAVKIEVKAVNGKAADGGLDYDAYAKNGMSVIAVGGNKLSRGLTLEGLMVSYYTRMSKMYDTLLQMGRWFGFRNGYADLCRLYTSRTLVKWYRHISLVNEEFRQELDDMAALPGATPENYGLKVRTHPDGMIITAMNKMRNSEKRRVTFAGRIVQVSKYYRDSSVNKQNLEFVDKWISEMDDSHRIQTNIAKNSYVWNDVTPERIFDFLDHVKVHRECYDASGKILKRYIHEQNLHNELIDWTAALISVGPEDRQSHHDFTISIGGHLVKMPWRTDVSEDEYCDPKVVALPRRNLITPEHQALDLSKEQYAAALKDTIANWAERKSKKPRPKEPSQVFVRQHRNKQNALLLIYVFRSGKDIKADVYPEIYVGYAISFPASKQAKDVEYSVDEVYRANNLPEDDEEEN